MKIEAGKRYILRDGQVTGKLRRLKSCTFYPFYDGKLEFSFTESGTYWNEERDSQKDIIAEYINPKKKVPRKRIKEALQLAIDELQLVSDEQEGRFGGSLDKLMSVMEELCSEKQE